MQCYRGITYIFD